MPRDALKGLRPGDPRDIKVAAFEIENEETFHLKELYKYIHDYICQQEGFVSYYGDDLPEVLYLEKTDGKGFTEHRIWWRFYQYPNNNSYFRYFLKVDLQTIASTKKEVIKNGQKFKLDKTDLTIRVQSWVQLDYKEEWKKHWFLKNMDTIFRNRMYKTQIESFQMELYKATYRIQNKIKQFLQLATEAAMPQPFQPEKGMR